MQWRSYEDLLLKALAEEYPEVAIPWRHAEVLAEEGCSNSARVSDEDFFREVVQGSPFDTETEPQSDPGMASRSRTSAAPGVRELCDLTTYTCVVDRHGLLRSCLQEDESALIDVGQSIGGAEGCIRVPTPVLTGQELGGFRIGSMLAARGSTSLWAGRSLGEEKRVVIKVLTGAPERLHRGYRQFLGGLHGLKDERGSTCRLYLVGLKSLEPDPRHRLLCKELRFVPSVYIVMELADGGCLGSEYRQQVILSRNPRRRYLDHFASLADGLNTIHDAGMVHADIKPQNVLWFRATNRVKLSDFGLHFFGGDDPSASGSDCYSAPEVRHGEPSREADIYSLGATLYHVLTGWSPTEYLREGHKGNERRLSAHRVLRGGLCSERLSKLLDSMTCPDPDGRPTLDTVLYVMESERRSASVSDGASAPLPRAGLPWREVDSPGGRVIPLYERHPLVRRNELLPGWEAPAAGGMYTHGGRRALSVTIVVVLLPVAALMALPIVMVNWIRFGSVRRILCIQPRIGYRGRVFSMLKFRTMHESWRGDYDSWHSGEDRLELTPYGRFLRTTQLDELPQLWNVLRGDMEVVGPRPELLEVDAWACRHIPGFRRRNLVPPGITGYAQVTHGTAGREQSAYEAKLQKDLEYVSNQSLGTDLRILWRTIFALLSGKFSGWRPGSRACTSDLGGEEKGSVLSNDRRNPIQEP